MPESATRAKHVRVTVVNDSPEFLELMAELLHDANYPTTLIDGDRDNAVALIEAAEPHVLIIDLRLGSDELHGWDVLEEVRSRPDLRRLPTIICTGDSWNREDIAEKVATMPNVRLLLKPFTIEELHASLDQVLGRDQVR